MEQPKASLEWHGSTLLAHVAGLLARTLEGPLVVVRAADQTLPPLPPLVEIAVDARDGGGPLEGIAAGLRAVERRTPVVFVSAVDVPLLQPAFVRRVLQLLDDDAEAAVPRVGSHIHPLTAAYRVSLLPIVEELLAGGGAPVLDLLARVATRFLDEADLLADREVRARDPALDSLRNLNTPAEYDEARALPAPPVWVRRRWVSAPEGDPVLVHAATLGEAARVAGLVLDDETQVALNGEPVRSDPGLPLVAGDAVAFVPGEPRLPRRR
jgi:molybdopterin-guanine dinucleotide biosynthesis protein A